MMNINFKTLAIVLILIMYGTAINAQKYVQVWADEFNTPGLPDSTKWDYEIGQKRNNELQYYAFERFKNSRIEDTVLIIEAYKESFEGANYTSASIISKGIGDWQYGKFEISAKVPSGKGTWPCIWMLPTYSIYGGWPKSGEIDIMEYIGVEPQNLFYTAHFEGDDGTGKDKSGSGGVKAITNPFNQFIKFELVWTPEKLEWFANGVKYHEYIKPADDYRIWPFDKRFYMILNLAYGGNWGGYNGVDDSQLPYKFLVDYVRVYQLQESEGPFLLNVKSEGNGQVEISPIMDTYPENTEVSVTALPNEGFSFAAWQHYSKANPYVFTIRKNTDITAIFNNPLELLKNGNFATGTSPWSFYVDDEKTIKFDYFVENNAFVVNVIQAPLTDWKLGFQENGIALQKGKYKLVFDAFADEEKNLLITLSKNYGDWGSIVSKTFSISKDSKSYTWEFELENDDNNTRFYFGIGNFTGKFTIDNISLIKNELSNSFVKLNESKKKSQFSIHPNPSNGLFQIKTNHKNEDIYVNVFSIDGKKVWSKNISSENRNIDLTKVTKGIYLVNLRTSETIETHSIVKK